MDERTQRLVKESIARHGDEFWTDADCYAGGECSYYPGEAGECARKATADCPYCNVHLFDDILTCLNVDGLDLVLIGDHKLDRALEGKS